MGNYKGFGDSKFVPDLKPEQFELIVKNSKAWADDSTNMQTLWESCKSPIW
jgi:dipeptidyl-peptidase-3